MERRTERILIVDDSPFEAKEIKSILEELGFEVLWANTGVQGMKQIRNHLPDLIILDLVLPDINGHEICKWLRKQEDTRNIPVIMVTAKEKMEDKILGLAEGANDYITKPFVPQELKARVEVSIRIKRLQDELLRKNEAYEGLLKQVQKMAETDPVTGLFNRRYFQEVLQQEFARSQRSLAPLCCMMIDVDGFKQINDSLGHEAGDQVLMGIGKIVQTQIRNVDLVARYGGDEMVVLLPGLPRDDGRSVAERILNQVRGYKFPALEEKQRLTVSIGLAALPDPGVLEPRQLVLAADYALYQSKHRGRNRVEAATFREMDSEAN